LNRFPQKIVSGGQTGADRAALDFAIAHGIPHGGLYPRGRKAEGGNIDARYILKENPSSSYPRQMLLTASIRNCKIPARLTFVFRT